MPGGLQLWRRKPHCFSGVVPCFACAVVLFAIGQRDGDDRRIERLENL